MTNILERKTVSLNAKSHLQFIEIVHANIPTDFRKTTYCQIITMDTPIIHVTLKI